MTSNVYRSTDDASVHSTTRSDVSQLLRRLHFYIGLFVGPFILIAAVTGTLFVLTPQIESHLYAEQLFNTSAGRAHTLDEQVAVAKHYIGTQARLFAVRPAKEPGWNSRIMFTQAGLGDSESRAVFIDPVSLAVKGDLIVYGTSGTLPFRTTLDYLHRNLLLGDLGRNYSELAASWLWIGSLSGLYLWWAARRKARSPVRRPASARSIHSLLGLWIVIGLVFFSATGLTWSRWAGGNVDLLRARLGWVTPSASMQLADRHAEASGGEHAHHHGGSGMTMPPMPATSIEIDTAKFDLVQSIARAGGIDAKELEIRPPRHQNQAWMVREVDRSWPTQVDTVAIDADRKIITSRADFASFPLIAKLIRWGVDAHMGILFGLVNQIAMALFGIALTAMIILGYVMWWKRRPAISSSMRTLSAAFLEMPLPYRIPTVVLALLLGWGMPLMGLSLIVFLMIDILRFRLSRVQTTS
jgi:uncharacterized iron-regulated membrane protein